MSTKLNYFTVKVGTGNGTAISHELEKIQTSRWCRGKYVIDDLIYGLIKGQDQPIVSTIKLLQCLSQSRPNIYLYEDLLCLLYTAMQEISVIRASPFIPIKL